MLFQCPRTDGTQQTVESHHDPRHRWGNGEQGTLPPIESINRLFENIERKTEEMPKVTAVTGLLLRRQTRRRWEPETLQ